MPFHQQHSMQQVQNREVLKFTCSLSGKVLHPFKLNHYMSNAAEVSACSTLPSVQLTVHRLYVPITTTLKLRSMASTMTAAGDCQHGIQS